MNYSELSDFEINRLVAESLNPKAVIEYDWHNRSSAKKSKRGVVVCPMNGMEAFSFNPCRDVNDAWPIILENKISIVNPLSPCGEWDAFVFDNNSRPDIEHKNPLRAAMIVYLMMQEGK